MASNERAIINNLNERARFFGGPDAPQLTIYDVRAVLQFFDRKSCKSGEFATSLDHVKPLSLGGENIVENLQVLTDNENKGKGDNEADYRNGRICTKEYAQSFYPPEKTYKKHDWDAIEHEYVTTNKSMREISKQFQVHENQLMNRAVVERWHKKRETFTSNLLAEANEEVAERAVKLIADEKFDVLKEGIALYKDAVERWQIGGNKVDLHEIVDLWKPLAAALGEVTERTQNNVSELPDNAAILARVNRLFDTGEEERTYSPLGPAGEEPSAGYSDAI